jgi:hypothetical protein
LKHFIKNQKAISQAGATVAIAIALLIAAVSVAGMYFLTSENNEYLPQQSTAPLTAANYGAHTMNVGGHSGFPGVTTSYSEATDFVVQWVSPSTGQILNPSASNGTGSINIPQNDAGIVWAVVEPGTGLYVDSESIVTKNSPYVGQAMYGPVFGNGVNYWYFAYNVNNAVPYYNAAPSYSFGAYFKPYGAITLSSPADISSVGTASVDKWIGWTATFASVNHAFSITKMVLTVNTTTTTNKIMFYDFAFPGQTTVVSNVVAAPSQATLGSTDFTYQISQSIQGARTVQYTTNTQNSLDFKTHVTCNLASGDVITAQLTIYGLNVDGKTIVSTTDTVNLSA